MLPLRRPAKSIGIYLVVAAAITGRCCSWTARAFRRTWLSRMCGSDGRSPGYNKTNHRSTRKPSPSRGRYAAPGSTHTNHDKRPRGQSRRRDGSVPDWIAPPPDDSTVSLPPGLTERPSRWRDRVPQIGTAQKARLCRRQDWSILQPALVASAIACVLGTVPGWGDRWPYPRRTRTG